MRWMLMIFVVGLAAGCVKQYGSDNRADSSPQSGVTTVSQTPDKLPVRAADAAPASADMAPTTWEDPIIPFGAGPVLKVTRENLAQRLSIPVESIRVVSIEGVEWPDSSMGCPRPKMMYTQVITPGYKVRLGSARRVYEYHTDAEGDKIILCD